MLGKKHSISQNDNFSETILSNKPLWISDVKASLSSFFPSSMSQSSFEQIKDIMNQENSKDNIDQSEYPYYTTIKKIMYSFGDTNNPNPNTVIYMHKFIQKFILNFVKLISECEYKKIIEHFFSYEYEKFHNYKKLKFKNNIITGETNINDGNIDNNNISDDEGKSKKKKGDNENQLLLGEEEDFLLDNNVPANSQIEINNNGNGVQPKIGGINEKNSCYTENIVFQCERTENMDTKQYYEFFACRQHNFLSNGKKQFSCYLQNLLGKNFPAELNDFSNVEFLSFILKEEIRKVIIEAIKSKHPNKKLFILTQPLEVSDIEQFCAKETDNLSSFLKDYYSDMYLIQEFKKKNPSIDKNSNKYIKVKKSEGGKICLIIKKYGLIKDEEEAEYLRRTKKTSELQVMNAILMLKDNYVKIRNEKSKNKITMKNNNNIVNNNENDKTESHHKLMTIKDWLSYLVIENYYEYFLIKEYLHEINVDTVKLSELLAKITILNKVNKRKISNKFNEWIQMNTEEKNKIKEEFDIILKKQN